MPVDSLSDAPPNIRNLDGVPLTLAQVNWILRRYDDLQDVKGIESPMAVAIGDFKDAHKKKGGRWVEVEKVQPTVRDVHPPSSMTTEEEEEEKKKKKKGKVWQGELLKADDERRLVYGVVLKPRLDGSGQRIGEPDAQSHRARQAEIEKAAHGFMRDSRRMDREHQEILSFEKATPVESYLAPVDFEMGDKTVEEGSWVLVTHVPDDEIWGMIKSGEINAYSIRGLGRMRPVEQP